MSQIYIKEPPTNGKVLLKTTLGDMDIELWSKETPLACRNFVQLCMEGYYNGSVFHRIVRDFIAQTGDPTGTGAGGESVYGQPFKDEFHSRLKFNRRGLVGMASGGRDDNSSQFFITMNRMDDLTNKHTLFGKVTGDTLYNMIRLNDIPTDKEDHPLDPAPKITKAKVLDNPFDDIVPRIDQRRMDKKTGKQKSQSRATKNFSLLSFGEEAEGDEEQSFMASKELKIKSSHDVLKDDPKLSSELAVKILPALPPSDKEKKPDKRKRERQASDAQSNDDQEELDEGKNGEKKEEEQEEEGLFDLKMRQTVKKKLGHQQMSWEEEMNQEDDMVAIKMEKLRSESRMLKREMKEVRQKREEEIRKKEKEEALANEDVPDVIRKIRQDKLDFVKKKSLLKGNSREEQTMLLLKKFKSKLQEARINGTTPTTGDEDTPTPVGKDIGTGVEVEQEAEANPDNPMEWLGHQLTFKHDEDKVVVAKDANKQDEDTFDIHDPRNPLNKRRRKEGSGGDGAGRRGRREGGRMGGGRDTTRKRDQTKK